MKSTYCEYILEKILSTSEVGPILALIAPSPLQGLDVTAGPLARGQYIYDRASQTEQRSARWAS
jgi:hypothetical protein